MDAATFRVWAKLMHRQSNTAYEEAMIAATAIELKRTVLQESLVILNISTCRYSTRSGISVKHIGMKFVFHRT
jgi:hypothetical protein